jgi:hypothetical protein
MPAFFLNHRLSYRAAIATVSRSPPGGRSDFMAMGRTRKRARILAGAIALAAFLVSLCAGAFPELPAAGESTPEQEVTRLLAGALGAIGAALVVFLLLERRGAARFRDVALGLASRSPYRAGPTRSLERAPGLVRGTALACLVAGQVNAVALWLFIATRADDVILCVLPGIAASVTIWCCGPLLLFRWRSLRMTMKDAVQATAVVYAFAVVMALLHLGPVVRGWGGPSTARLLLFLSVGASALAASFVPVALILATVKVHGHLFEGLAAPQAEEERTGDQPNELEKLAARRLNVPTGWWRR